MSDESLDEIDVGFSMQREAGRSRAGGSGKRTNCPAKCSMTCGILEVFVAELMCFFRGR